MTLGDPDDGALKTWLWRRALPLWWDVGADRIRGGFEEGIDFAGQPVRLDRRLRVQARQTWVYATAHRINPSGGWGDAALHGLRALTERYRRADGLHHPAVTPQGVAVEGPVLMYDQAFVLLALAAVHRADVAPWDVRPYAETLMTRIVESFTLGDGGFREANATTPFYANPHMHLLEAALEWEEADFGTMWSALADGIAELALKRFIDPDIGVLREHFDADWRPAAGIQGRTLDVGHQFEWSWLLRRWGFSRSRGDGIGAETLLATGERFGLDPVRGVLFNTMLDDFTPLDRDARLWPQTERLKALTLAARDARTVQGRRILENLQGDAAEGLSLYLRTEIPGLWRDTLTREGAFSDQYAPASSFYHIAGAIFALQAVGIDMPAEKV